MERAEKIRLGEFYSAQVYLVCECPKCQTPEGAEDANHWPSESREFRTKTAAILWAGKELKRNPRAVGAAMVYRHIPDDDNPSLWPYIDSEQQVWAT